VARKKYSNKKIVRDIFLIVLSVYITVWLVDSGLTEKVFSAVSGLRNIGAFFVGMFFTSFFTIALASVILVKMASLTSVWQVAFWGALGAMVGDYIIFKFIRDFLADDILDFIRHSPLKKTMHFFKMRIFRWVWPTMGAAIIVSPLPDELGLAMMGISRMPTYVLLPMTFVFNYLGILLISSIAGLL
jgi:hypothetical protein